MSDKYEGHNISKVSDYQCGTATIDERKANWNLIQDAPHLLAEVKRLREGLQEMLNVFDKYNTSREHMRNRIETILKGEE